MKVGSIIVPMHDVWYHKTPLKQHFPFLISEPDTVQITTEGPTVIIEFTDEEPDVAEFCRTWLQQIEDGIIEIVDRWMLSKLSGTAKRTWQFYII